MNNEAARANKYDMIRVLFDVGRSGTLGVDNHTLSGATRDWPLDRFHLKKNELDKCNKCLSSVST